MPTSPRRHTASEGSSASQAGRVESSPFTSQENSAQHEVFNQDTTQSIPLSIIKGIMLAQRSWERFLISKYSYFV